MMKHPEQEERRGRADTCSASPFSAASPMTGSINVPAMTATAIRQLED
jgi:hypothetical protein